MQRQNTSQLPPALSIQQLNIAYQHQTLFSNFNLTFPANKWTALLGPSGVGKTTILRFLADLINPQDTQITGTIVTSDKLLINDRIAYLAQQDLLFPWLNVLENVLVGHQLRHEKNLSQVKEQALNLLKKVGLEKVIYLRPEKLSGGMRQRVALVRTLLENRPIILMDEPFSALDTITKLKLQNLAAELLSQHTVILVTHDPMEALRLCDHIYIIKGEPAKLQEATKPQGQAPRDPTNSQLLTEYAQLLQLLGEDA